MNSNDATDEDLQNSFELVKKLLPHLDACISILDEYKEKMTSIQYFQSSLKDIVSGFSELKRFIDLVNKDFFSDQEGINKEFTSTVLQDFHTFHDEFVGNLSSTLGEFKRNVECGFFYSLQTLHLHKPSRKAIEKVLEICPNVLYDPCDSERPIICFAAKHAGTDPSYVKMLLSIDPDQESMPFLEDLVDSDESDGANADVNRVRALKDITEMGFLENRQIRKYCCGEGLLQFCDCVRLPKVFDFLCSCDPYALLLDFWNDKPFITRYPCSEEGSLWDISKVAVYLEAGFKYWPEIGGLLFLKNAEGTSVLDDAFEIYGEEKVMEVLENILSKRSDFPILHHVFIKSPKYKDLFHKRFRHTYSLLDHSGRTLYQSILASGTAEMKATFSDMVLCVADMQLQEKDPITSLYPFAAVAEDMQLCFTLLRRNPSVLDEESRYVVSQKKRKRLNFPDEDYKDSLSGMALKLIMQYLRPIDVLSCAQTCKEWNVSIDDDVWAGIARRINRTSCQVIEHAGMGNITYKDMAMAFLKKELPLWKVPEMPQPLEADDVIFVIEIRQGWKWYGKRKLLGSYSCLLSNLQGAKNMEVHFRNCSETGAHIVIPASEIEKEVLQEINSFRKDPRSNFVPMHAFQRLEMKTFLMQKSTGRSIVLHDFTRIGKYFREEKSGRTIEGRRFSQSVTYSSGIPRTHEELVKRENFREMKNGKGRFLQSIGLTLAVVPQSTTKTENREPPKTAKQLRKEIRQLSQPLEYSVVNGSLEMEFYKFDNEEELLSFLRRLPWQ